MDPTTAQNTDDTSEALILRDFFPYRVRVFYTDVTSAVAAVYEGEDAMSPAEWRCMVILHASVTLKASEIAAASSMDKVTVSRAIAKLRKRGWIVAAANSKDGRSKILTLSESGRSTLLKLIPKALKVERELLAGISADQLDQFFETAAKISKNRAKMTISRR